MEKAYPHRSYDVFIQAVAEFDRVSDYIILEILHHDAAMGDMANNAAQALMNLKGLLKLCAANHFRKGWVLSKALWESFLKLRMREARFAAGIEADKPRGAGQEAPKGPKAGTQYRNQRYDSFKREQLMGNPDRNRQMGKELNLDFIYAHGYSKHSRIESAYMEMDRPAVEKRIEAISGEEAYRDEREVLQEACLLTCLILNETMNQSALEWKWILFDYLKGYYDFLEGRLEAPPIDSDKIKSQCDGKISKGCGA